jgi:hypothetical protein
MVLENPYFARPGHEGFRPQEERGMKKHIWIVLVIAGTILIPFVWGQVQPLQQETQLTVPSINQVNRDVIELRREVTRLKAEVERMARHFQVGDSHVRIEAQDIHLSGRIHLGKGSSGVSVYSTTTFHRPVHFNDKIHGLYHAEDK